MAAAQPSSRRREACHEDLAFHLEFLQPVLEFGLLQPMVEYLRWLNSILEARGVPATHLALSLDLLADFFAENMAAADAVVVAAARKRRVSNSWKSRTPNRLRNCPNPGRRWSNSYLRCSPAIRPEHWGVVNHCLDSGRDLIEVDLHIIKPALYHIGERWRANRSPSRKSLWQPRSPNRYRPIGDDGGLAAFVSATDDRKAGAPDVRCR